MWQVSGQGINWKRSKHIYVGETRVATKFNVIDGGIENNNTRYEEGNIYYYHGDHLGSAEFISGADGKWYERIEYTPYGETWIEERNRDGVAQAMPYRFTGKELDEETGLYYYGARYLDPRTSRWLSADPALGEYLPSAPVNDEARRRNGNLPGMGGVYNYVNLHVYHYAGNNPVKYVDPDGRTPVAAITAGIGFLIGGVYGAVTSYNETGEIAWGRVAKDALIGGGIGFLVGFGGSALITGNGLASTTEVITALGFGGTAAVTGLSTTAINKALESVGRVQHAARHLTDAGILPQWSRNTLDLARQLYTNILSHPGKVFDHVLEGGATVTGYLSQIDGKNVAVFIYKADALAGQIATSFVPTAKQILDWGL
jgi:RHS repeat-associated protein